MKIGGIVLCGGQSRRMGSPKAWLPFEGELMLPRVVRILSEVVEPIVVVAAVEQLLPPLPPEIWIVRDPVENTGPLQGLATGLAALRGTCEAAYLSSCDVPLLQPRFIGRMIELLGDFAIAVPEAEGFRHPLAAIYRTDVLPQVEEILANGGRSLQGLFQKCTTHFVSHSEMADCDPDLRSLRNLNTPEEYEVARRATW